MPTILTPLDAQCSCSSPHSLIDVNYSVCVLCQRDLENGNSWSASEPTPDAEPFYIMELEEQVTFHAACLQCCHTRHCSHTATTKYITDCLPSLTCFRAVICFSVTAFGTRYCMCASSPHCGTCVRITQRFGLCLHLLAPHQVSYD